MIEKLALEHMKDAISNIETRLRHAEIHNAELLQELRITKKALYLAVHNLLAVRYEDYNEAGKHCAEQIRWYINKAKNCADPDCIVL